MPLKVFNSLFGAWRTGMSGTICIKRKCTFAYSAVIYFILLRRVKRGRKAWYGGGQSISLEKRRLFKELGKIGGEYYSQSRSLEEACCYLILVWSIAVHWSLIGSWSNKFAAFGAKKTKLWGGKSNTKWLKADQRERRWLRDNLEEFEHHCWAVIIWNADLGSHYWASRSR